MVRPLLFRAYRACRAVFGGVLDPLRDHAALHRGVIAVAPVFWAAFAVFLHPAWGVAGFLVHAAACIPRRDAKAAARKGIFILAAFPLLALWFAAREPFLTLPEIPFHRTFAADQAPVPREGIVTGIPVPSARGFTFPFRESAGERLNYRVSLEARAGSEPPRWGSTVELSGIATPADPPLNPGQLDMRRVLRGQGADAGLRADAGPSAWRELRPPPLWKAGLMRARKALNASLEKCVPRPALPLLEASLLNNTTRVPADTQQAFFRSGMQHILAISGQHIGLLLAFLLLVSLCARLPRKFAFAIAAVLTAAYIPMVGAPVSVVRSGIMLACLLPAILLERPSAGLHALGLTATADLLLDPHNILNLGFQLSYAATLALILGSRPAQILARKIVGRASQEYARVRSRVFFRSSEDASGETPASAKHKDHGAAGNLCAGAVQMILLSALITLFTYPVLAASTHTTTPWGILGNVATVPVGAAMLIGGLCTWSLDFLLPAPLDAAAAWAGAATGLCALLLEAGVFLLARLPGALRSIADPSAAWLAVLAAGCACTTLLLRRERFLAAILCGAITLAAESARPAWVRLREGGPRVTFLAVGHGDAAVLELLGAVILIDAGDSPRVARNVILPFLQYRGIARLDAILITHPHLDHYGGVAALLDAVPVGRIVGPPEPEDFSDPSSPSYSSTWQCLRAKARARGIPWKEGRAGQRVYTGREVSLWVLSPGSSLAGEDKNNRSVATLLRAPRGRVLFTGDIEQPGQRALASTWPLWRGAWLKAPHHGSDRTTAPCFLEAAAPPRTVVSCGGRRGFPGARTLETLAGLASMTAVTKEDGAVTWMFGRRGARETRYLTGHPADHPAEHPSPN